MKAFSKYVKGHDMFGHTINLNFNKQGDTHQTFIGGFFSLIVKSAMTVYVLMNMKKMFFYESDTLNVEI